MYPDQIEYVMDSYVSVTKQIHNLPFNTHWDTVEDLLNVIDTTKTKLIPNNLILKALNLKISLLKSSKNKKLLHGDLHLGNILKQGNGWLCIDPKPIIGEPEFEMAAFDFTDTSEIQNATQELLKTRISLLASKSGLSEERIRDWTFIRLILSAIWSIEDHNDPTIAIKLAHLI